MLFHLDALLQAVDLQHPCHGAPIVFNKLI
jgi:hypothetical protein